MRTMDLQMREQKPKSKSGDLNVDMRWDKVDFMDKRMSVEKKNLKNLEINFGICIRKHQRKWRNNKKTLKITVDPLAVVKST